MVLLEKKVWKEVVKVSVIVGVASFFLPFNLHPDLLVNPLLGVIATGFILSKKLDTKSSWGIGFGMIFTGLVLGTLGVIDWYLIGP